MQIPDWIEPEAMEGFIEMRKSIKKPLTARALSLVINRLGDFKAKGHDPNAILDQSVLNNWQGLYEVKQEPITNLKREYMKSLGGPMTPEQKAAADEVRKKLFPIRRVA
jgi:hypothetical protein